MNIHSEIKLYGTERCHKTKYYQDFLEAQKVQYAFFDVEANDDFAEDLRNLYSNKKLNFPTLVVGCKTLRNPSERELIKWINK